MIRRGTVWVLAAALVTVAMLGACNSGSGFSTATVIGQTGGGLQGSTAGLILYESLRAASTGEILAVSWEPDADPVRLTASGYHNTTPAWSPDGKRIIFSATAGTRADLWWANIDNTPVLGDDGELTYFQQVTDERGFNQSPDWSVNDLIVFQSDRVSNQFDIFTIAPDGSLLTRLTTDLGSDNNPSWSPDGTEIAFGSDRGGQPEIYVMNADGSNVRKITEAPVGGAHLAPAWSPDGTKIAFVVQPGSTTQRDIWLMNPDGSGQVAITDDGQGNHFPCWSPDGLHLAYERLGRENAADIWVMDVDGANKRVMAPARERDACPAWSPATL